MDKQREALEALKAMACITITPVQAAAALGCTPQYIRIVARNDPKKLGFPVLLYGKPTRHNPHGSRIKIYRVPFIRFVEDGNHNKGEKRSDEDAKNRSERKRSAGRGI